VGECFFWYRPTRVVPDQRPLNGRCCYFHNSSKKEHITKYNIKSKINSTEAKIKLISKKSTRTTTITVKVKIKYKKYDDYAKALYKFSTYLLPQ